MIEKIIDRRGVEGTVEYLAKTVNGSEEWFSLAQLEECCDLNVLVAEWERHREQTRKKRMPSPPFPRTILLTERESQRATGDSMKATRLVDETAMVKDPMSIPGGNSTAPTPAKVCNATLQ